MTRSLAWDLNFFHGCVCITSITNNVTRYWSVLLCFFPRQSDRVMVSGGRFYRNQSRRVCRDRKKEECFIPLDSVHLLLFQNQYSILRGKQDADKSDGSSGSTMFSTKTPFNSCLAVMSLILFPPSECLQFRLLLCFWISRENRADVCTHFLSSVLNWSKKMIFIPSFLDPDF